MTRSGGSRDAGTVSDLYCEIEGEPVALRAEDLTTAGLFIETKTPYAMDRELGIYMRSSIGELHACGQVVQVVDKKRARLEQRRPGFGLLFTTLEDDHRAFIGLTLDALARARALAKAPAAPPPPKPVSVRPPKIVDVAALKAIEAELRAELIKLQGKTAWTALGLEADAPLGAAKEAFLRVSKRFHPHKFARHDSADITKLATEVFIAYKRAYDVLTKLAPRSSHAQPRAAARAERPTVTSISPTATTAQPKLSVRPAGDRRRSR